MTRWRENLAGVVHHSWYAFGEYDIIAVVEMPDNKTMAAYVLAMKRFGISVRWRNHRSDVYG